MAREKKNHGDFFKFFKKEYPDVVTKMGRKWTPDRWDSRYDYFDVRESLGWKEFINSLPKPMDKDIQNIVFEWLTELLDVNDLMEKTQKMVNNYWNKIVICKTINTDEENRFKRMMNALKDLSELHSKGMLRKSTESYSINLTNIQAERFEYSELPPDSKLINNRIYPTTNGYWWEISGLNIDNFGIIYFKPNETKKVPEMKCTFQDGVFMAIPSELISNNKLTERFTKLIGNDNGDKPQGKVSKKKRPTRREISNMDFEDLALLIEDYNLDIDIDEFEDDEIDNPIDLQDAVMEAMEL